MDGANDEPDDVLIFNSISSDGVQYDENSSGLVDLEIIILDDKIKKDRSTCTSERDQTTSVQADTSISLQSFDQDTTGSILAESPSLFAGATSPSEISHDPELDLTKEGLPSSVSESAETAPLSLVTDTKSKRDDSRSRNDLELELRKLNRMERRYKDGKVPKADDGAYIDYMDYF